MAASPFTLSHGGRLTTVDGKPVAGPVDIQIKFFRVPEDGVAVPVSIPVFEDVVLAQGTFTVQFALSAADYNAVFDLTQETWIEVKNVTDNRTYPRQRFMAVPYALKVPVDGTTIEYDAFGNLHALTGGGGNMNTVDYDNDANLKADDADHAVDADHADLADLATLATTATTATTATNATNLGGNAPAHYLDAGNLTGNVAYARLPVGTAVSTVAAGNDARFTDSRTPNGTAGGGLTGTYPNPTVASVPDGALSANVTLLGSDVNLANAETIGTLPVAKGGTGVATLTGIVKANGVGAFTAATASDLPLISSLAASDSLPATALTVDADGAVGIGTPTPGWTLDVLGSGIGSRAANNGYVSLNPGDGAIEIGSGNNASSYIDFKGSANLAGDFEGRLQYSDALGWMVFADDAVTPKFFIGESGSLGVGTFTPDGALDMQGTHVVTTGNRQYANIGGTLDSSSSGTHYGMYVHPWVHLTNAGPVDSVTGLFSKTSIGSGTNDPAVTLARGSLTFIETTADYTGTIATAMGVGVAQPQLNGSNKIADYSGFYTDGVTTGATRNSGNTTGTISNRGLFVGAHTASSGVGGTINNYGAYINVPNGSGASGVTNNYGLFLANNGTAGDTNYSLYNASSTPSMFVGSVQVGETLSTGTEKIDGRGAFMLAAASACIAGESNSSRFAVFSAGTATTCNAACPAAQATATCVRGWTMWTGTYHYTYTTECTVADPSAGQGISGKVCCCNVAGQSGNMFR